jgi:hypothetical protein
MFCHSTRHTYHSKAHLQASHGCLGQWQQLVFGLLLQVRRWQPLWQRHTAKVRHEGDQHTQHLQETMYVVQ